jgi:hydroxymethylbilane synthase
MKLRIATRKSPLAVWQARHVAGLLQAMGAEHIELVELMTKGDKILDQALSKVGGKDLFVKEIEHALLDGSAEVAVHSLKDMPTVLPEGLAVTAYPRREDPRDALVSPKGYTIATLPERAKVGTCSLRRAAQLRRLRPDLEIVPIRGNVQTRLRKLDEEGMDATVLAYAGLLRLEMTHVASEILDPEVSLPAIGQGILAVETREARGHVESLVSRLDDPSTRAAAVAERSFLHRLEGGCQVPIAGHATIDGDRLRLRGLVASLDGQRVVEDELSGPFGEPARIGVDLANRLLDAGAREILDELQR